jgi:23S rRNA pseudouridine1911/1915/1917 synthase
MNWLGHSVVGDERYGTKGGRMGLHAFKLSFTHPVSKNPLIFEVDAPRDFYGLLS